MKWSLLLSGTLAAWAAAQPALEERKATKSVRCEKPVRSSLKRDPQASPFCSSFQSHSTTVTQGTTTSTTTKTVAPPETTVTDSQIVKETEYTSTVTETDYTSTATSTSFTSTATETDVTSTVTKTDYTSTSTETDFTSTATETEFTSTATKTEFSSTETDTEYTSTATATSYNATSTEIQYTSTFTSTVNAGSTNTVTSSITCVAQANIPQRRVKRANASPSPTPTALKGKSTAVISNRCRYCLGISATTSTATVPAGTETATDTITDGPTPTATETRTSTTTIDEDTTTTVEADTTKTVEADTTTTVSVDSTSTVQADTTTTVDAGTTTTVSTDTTKTITTDTTSTVSTETTVTITAVSTTTVQRVSTTISTQTPTATAYAKGSGSQDYLRYYVYYSPYNFDNANPGYDVTYYKNFNKAVEGVVANPASCSNRNSYPTCSLPGGQTYNHCDQMGVVIQGYLLAPVTGTFTFTTEGNSATSVDNYVGLWTGQKAYTQWNNNNADFQAIRAGPNAATFTGGVYSVFMQQGQLLPVTIIFINGGGIGNFVFNIVTPDGVHHSTDTYKYWLPVCGGTSNPFMI